MFVRIQLAVVEIRPFDYLVSNPLFGETLHGG